MTEEIPKVKASMDEVADHTRKQDLTLPLPNREIRRKFKKLKKKPHFKAELAKSGITPEKVEHAQEEAVIQMSPDEETKAKLLENLDVKRFLDVLNGILTGQKKLVVKSTPFKHRDHEDKATGMVGYMHTFRVEGVNARSK